MDSRSNTSRQARRGAVPLALAAITCALLVGACGSAKPHTTTVSSDWRVKFSDCMRANGASNFPDPSPQGGLNGGPPSKTETQSPRYTSAFNICRKLMPHGGPPPGPGFNEHQLQQMVAKVQCIREHGFPTLPDPEPDGNNIGRGTSPAGWNPHAPAAIKAMKACAKVGIGIPGWLVS
jgi:hypothetical protein